jgi:hypothetical protein
MRARCAFVVVLTVYISVHLARASDEVDGLRLLDRAANLQAYAVYCEPGARWASELSLYLFRLAICWHRFYETEPLEYMEGERAKTVELLQKAAPKDARELCDMIRDLERETAIIPSEQFRK